MNGQDLSETQKITQGYVQYHDGQKMDGFIKRFHATSSRITFRKTKKGSNNNIKSKQLSEIGLFRDGDTLIFHRHALGRYFNKGKNLKELDIVGLLKYIVLAIYLSISTKRKVHT